VTWQLFARAVTQRSLRGADSRHPDLPTSMLVHKIHSLLSVATLALILLVCSAQAGAEALSDSQVEAVFLFNFTHFVTWPSAHDGEPGGPFVIGILGDDEFGAHLDETVRGELINDHPLIIRRFHRIEEVSDCRILFIDHSESAQLGRILSTLDHRSILTVSDIPGAAEHGVMIQFTVDNNRVRLRINQDPARTADLSLSSKLLRVAELVGTSKGE
jgi:hypothetical protein